MWLVAPMPYMWLRLIGRPVPRDDKATAGTGQAVDQGGSDAVPALWAGTDAGKAARHCTVINPDYQATADGLSIDPRPPLTTPPAATRGDGKADAKEAYAIADDDLPRSVEGVRPRGAAGNAGRRERRGVSHP